VHGGQALRNIDARGTQTSDIRAGWTNALQGRVLSKILDVVRLLEYTGGMEVKQARPEDRGNRESLAAEGVTGAASAANGRSEIGDDFCEVRLRCAI
jgi:hypothetical protein